MNLHKKKKTKNLHKKQVFFSLFQAMGAEEAISDVDI